MALYKEINNVPGLSGSSFQRQKQLYERLGSPQGAYRGSYNQNIWLLNQIRNGAAKNAMQPKPTPKPTPKPQTSSNTAKDFANNAGADKVFKGPVFSEVLPFYEAWGGMIPAVTEEANSMINPFINRELRTAQRGITNQMAQTGGGRFAASQGRLGNAWAESERNRRAQVEDWINQRRQGFKTLFYDPSEEAYNRAIELGQKPNSPNLPMTYEEMQRQMNGGQQTQPANTPQKVKPTYEVQPYTPQKLQGAVGAQGAYSQWQDILNK